jgi:poly-beta-1,6-N-acetyl-D-glucosamine synthase
MTSNSYVLITPARNEEALIEKTIRAVTAQTILPLKWVIISDKSTDRTDEIIKKYASSYSFIEFERITDQGEWNFSSKVNAINSGLKKIVNLEFELIGFLDADVTFESNYYEQVLMQFKKNEKLGIGGGMILELSGDTFKHLNYNVNSVAGAVQLFRKTCFDKIGGYIPLQSGGIDAVAEVMARMNGWQVRSFPEIYAYHHRKIGVTKGNILSSKWRYGTRDYLMGTHPLFMFLKSIYRFREKPYVLSGLLMIFGYLWPFLRKKNIPIPHDVVEYTRKEQMKRIVSALTRSKYTYDTQKQGSNGEDAP